MHAATLATDGYVVLRDVVTPEQLAALRAECDALCAALAAEGVCLADEGCVVEVFRRSRPEPRASARTERAAYDAARRQALCGGVGAEQRDAAVERALFQSLPAAVQGALGADAPLWLFNEQHVVKPARSTCTFAWHRDAEEQLALCTDLGLQQGSSTPYVSVWLPLDDCSARNGTLVVLPRFEVRFSCMHCVADKSDVRAVQPWESEQAADARGIALDVPAGGACAFTSDLWHASGCNSSDAPRRVFYAQYSTAPIVSIHDGTPLSFAVPVGGA
jgi:ectoine hydroxylase-related dioxygenase (phytanoyl-CoA dioxygenase family)